MNPPENSTAFGAPGIEARWASSAKEGAGRSQRVSPSLYARCCTQRDRGPRHHGAACGAMNFFCVGLSHHTANVEIREQFAGNATADSIARKAGCAEALLLTTCNRVEVYGVSDKRISNDEIARCLMAKTNGNPYNNPLPLYRHEDNECIQHLFRVASGLDSMVVGESEILGQAKKAYESARTSGAVGPYLHRLFQRAFRVAKQVRTHTDISRGAVSVGSVAVQLAQRIFGKLSECKVLVLGAGETSERTTRALVSRGVTDLRVSNRSLDRARELAHSVGRHAVPFDDWVLQCREIDILLTSTASETPLLTPEILAPMLWQRSDRPLFIIDIAVPRDVDPSVDELEGVYLYDIDSIRSVAEQSLALRRQQVAAAEAIIADHVTEFFDSMSRGLNRLSQAAEHSSLGENPLGASDRL
jgi:glutamyl-tRNA reductase